MPPRVHPGTVRRARLFELLDGERARAGLTVVDAGVGYSKTTLVRTWCVERPEPVIWMTLDPADDDPVRLWTHLATATERLGEGLGRRVLMCLAARGAPIDTAVEELVNGLVVYGRPATIVLDDLHGQKRGVASIDRPRDRAAARERTIARPHAVRPRRRARPPEGSQGADRDPLTRARLHRRRSSRADCLRTDRALGRERRVARSADGADGRPACTWRHSGFATSSIPTRVCARSPAALVTSATI
jgi:hypothetical protein